jgi:hypothetical protein
VTGAEQILDYTLVRRLQARVADELSAQRQQRIAAGMGEMEVADQRQQSMSLTRTVVSDYLREQMQHGIALPEDNFDTRLVAAIDAAIWGAGELQALLDDPDIENIDINGCDGVWVTYADARGTVPGRPVAPSDTELVDVVRTLGTHAGVNARPFTPTSPQLDLRLGGGSRLSAVMTVSDRSVVLNFGEKIAEQIRGAESGEVGAINRAAATATEKLLSVRAGSKA